MMLFQQDDGIHLGSDPLGSKVREFIGTIFEASPIGAPQVNSDLDLPEAEPFQRGNPSESATAVGHNKP